LYLHWLTRLILTNPQVRIILLSFYKWGSWDKELHKGKGWEAYAVVFKFMKSSVPQWEETAIGVDDRWTRVESA
jgi:hypothetical protein